MLLLSYHRFLRMISEALELCVEGGQVSHSWCICVVGHGYGGYSWNRDGGGELYACVTMPEGLVLCQEMPEHFSSASCYTDDTRSQHLPDVRLWLGLSRKWSVFLGRP